MYPTPGTIRPRVVAEVDASALLHNARLVQACASEVYGCGTVAVVKADAYGHGAVAVSRLLERHAGVTFFAVATLSEVRLVREPSGQQAQKSDKLSAPPWHVSTLRLCFPALGTRAPRRRVRVRVPRGDFGPDGPHRVGLLRGSPHRDCRGLGRDGGPSPGPGRRPGLRGRSGAGAEQARWKRGGGEGRLLRPFKT